MDITQLMREGWATQSELTIAKDRIAAQTKIIAQLQREVSGQKQEAQKKSYQAMLKEKDDQIALLKRQVKSLEARIRGEKIPKPRRKKEQSRAKKMFAAWYPGVYSEPL